MEVKVGGRLRIGFFPGLHVTLEDLHIRNRGADVASATEARLGNAEMQIAAGVRPTAAVGTLLVAGETVLDGSKSPNPFSAV